MYCVYILQSLKDNNFYVGCTADLSKRIKAHNSGKVTSTQRRKPFRLVAFIEFGTLSEARKKEAFLKSYQGSREKYQLIRNFPQDLLNRFNEPRGPATSKVNRTGPLVQEK